MDVQTHISWPVCGNCSGTGQVAKQGGVDDGRCGTCKGAGRVKPEGWKVPIWAPTGLVDPGSDPELREAVKEGRITLVKPDDPAPSKKQLDGVTEWIGKVEDAAATEIAALKKRVAELEKKAG